MEADGEVKVGGEEDDEVKVGGEEDGEEKVGGEVGGVVVPSPCSLVLIKCNTAIL